MQSAESLEDTERIPLAIIQLGAECFGVGLDVVREFSHLRRVTAIPCCPSHIAGNMNLRGDILTLVDIRGLLNIPAEGNPSEVMVVEAGDLSIGSLRSASGRGDCPPPIATNGPGASHTTLSRLGYRNGR